METDTVEITTPSPESVAEETASQASEQSPQGDVQKQEGEQLKVDQPAQQTSSEQTVRPLPSAAYKIRQMEKSIKQMSKHMEELVKNFNKKQNDTTVSKPSLSPEEYQKKVLEFYEKPLDYFDKVKQEAKEELLKELREKELPTFLDSFEKSKDLNRRKQEALELIYPKSGSTNEPLDVRANKDPRHAVLEKLWEDWGLNAVFEVDPEKAAKKLLQLYEMEKSNAKRNPLAPKKSQMGSSASGSPIGGSRMSNPEDLKKTAQDLGEKLTQDPSLLNDSKFMEKWELAMKSLSEYKE